MVIRVIVSGQSIRWYGKPPEVADDSIEYVQWQFNLPEDWLGLVVVAQFTQGETYNCLLKEGICFMPKELTPGLCQVSVFGYSGEGALRATTIPLKFTIQDSGFVGDGETPIPPTPDLYAQLIEYFSSQVGSGGGSISPEAIAAAVEDYLTKNPIEPPDLSEQVGKAETAAETATSQAAAAEKAATEAKNSADRSGNYATQAQAALSGASEAASNAKDSASQAQAHAASASGSAGYANTRANYANASAIKAEEAASDAEAAAARAEEAAKVTTDLDKTLTQEGKAADAKAVGDAISKLSGGNAEFTTDETLTLKNGVLSVNTTNDMEQDNTLPITSAGVFATVGNIEALLKTI